MAELTIPGNTTIEDDVVASVAGLAAREVEGVAGLGRSLVRRIMTDLLGRPNDKARAGVDVEVGTREAIVDLTLGIIYGYSIPEVVAEVRRLLASRLTEITGLVAKEINVRVVNIEFPRKEEGRHSRVG